MGHSTSKRWPRRWVRCLYMHDFRISFWFGLGASSWGWYMRAEDVVDRASLAIRTKAVAWRLAPASMNLIILVLLGREGAVGAGDYMRV